MMRQANLAGPMLHLVCCAVAGLAAALADVAPLAAAPDPAVMRAYQSCVRERWPTIDDAEGRAAACSKALQSRELAPREVANARLSRGVARMALGDRMLAADDYAEALKHYNAVLDAKNPDALGLAQRATSLEGLGETDRALADYTEALKRDPRATLALLGRGTLLASRKRSYSRAVEDFDRVLVIAPDSVDALIARGSALAQLGQFARAAADFNKAIALEPNNVQAYVERGIAYTRNGDINLAIQDFDAALKRNPRSVNGLVNRAASNLRIGKTDLAIRDLDDALKLDGLNPIAFYNRGYANFLRKNYDKAISDYSLAIALDPQMGVAFNNRCLTRGVLGVDLVRALGDCDTALKLMPLNLDVRTTRGFIFLKLGDPRLALHEYDAVLDVDPNKPLALYGRGLARIAIGETRQGEGDKAAALVLDPEVAQAFSDLGVK